MIYYQDETVTLHHGDSLEVARSLPDKSVDCIVTSPPYYGLRDYGNEGQYGLEPTPEEYVQRMVDLFHELRRVLADDGTFWLNLGDSYGRGSRKDQPPDKFERAAGRAEKRPDAVASGLPNKSLLGIPWRVAFALQQDGWILRNSIIWNKPNGMPESVRDRLTNSHENLFLFTKRERYHFDLDPIREPITTSDPRALSFDREETKERLVPGSSTLQHRPRREGNRGGTPWSANANNMPGVSPQQDVLGTHPKGKNPGDVWTIATQPFPGAHFATFPQELARRCIVSGCKPAGVVLDPFSGSGTTGLVAQNNGRRYVGVDISREYLELSLNTRLQNAVLDLSSAAGWNG